MAEYLIQDTTLTGIADAIRSKTGESENIAVTNMASKISAISASEDLTAELDAQSDLIQQLSTILDSKAAGGSGGFTAVSTFADIDIEGAVDGTMYKYAGATTRYLIYTNNTWQVFSDGGSLITSVDAAASAYNIGNTEYRTFAFADYPDTSKAMTISFQFTSGLAMNYSTLFVMLGSIRYGGTTVYNSGGWVIPSTQPATYKSLSLLIAASTAISLEAYLWLLCNGTFTEAYAPTAYTTTFTVSDTSDVTVNFSSAGGKHFVPDSFVATIVGTGSSNSVCSVVAIGTTTATYTRTTSGTATSSGGTNTVTYSSGKIVIPNKTTTSSSYNLKKGTWRIVAWNSGATQLTTVVEESNDAGGTTLNIT